MNNFQTILVAVFLAFFVFAVLIFSGVFKIGKSSSTNSGIVGKIVIWGTLPADKVSDSFQNLSTGNSTFSVSYVQKSEKTYQAELTDAFAKDKSPDLFILTPDMVLKNDNFIYKVPYASFPEKSYRNLFIDGADLYIAKDGIVGYPILVDPIVLYYNKDMLSNEGILFPPTTWDQLFDLGSKLTKKKPDGTISTSMIAFGQYDNVNHAKDVLSMLLLQSGNPIVSRKDDGYSLNIKDSNPDGSFPLEMILNFFLEFSNPSKDIYTWNRSLPNSIDMFTSGKLAFYVGYASELFKIQSVNPNLSFDVSTIPQTKGTISKRTYGNIYTLVVSKKSKSLASSFGLATMITGPDFMKELGVKTSLPTASRSLLNDKPTDPYLLTFFNSAIISRSWLDPNKEATDSIFSEMVQNSLSNKLSVSEAMTKASNQLDLILNQK